jgi:hypothetical protein
MALSRKHYRWIAKAINNSTIVYKGVNKHMINKDNLIDDLCGVFIGDNALFNRSKFEDACNM